MEKRFVSVGKYIQGPKALDNIGGYLAPYGTKVLCVGGKRGLEATREKRNRSFEGSGITQTEMEYSGECCDEGAKDIMDAAAAAEAEVLMACGGGKVIDAVKLAADQMKLTCVIVPTTISNDAPCSGIAVTHNEDGSFNRLQGLRSNPQIVLVDTSVIAKAPIRQLASGMGDALATWYEAKSKGINSVENSITETGKVIAKLSRDLILSYGLDAIKECEEKVPGPALEKIAEANTLLSGLGFENCCVGAAHALSETMVEIPGMEKYSHGELVSFGIPVHMILENEDPDEIRRVATFLRQAGLPACLKDLGLEAGAAVKKAAYEAAAPEKPSHNLKADITGDEIYEAIIKADEI